MNIPGDLQATQQTENAYPTTNVVNKTTVAEPATTDQVSATASITDLTHLSAAANIVSQLAGQPDVRTEKVASVQAAIASGSYHVDAAEVAGKLIDHMLGNGK
jgi:flagellar biosynthesis anti-sigma factor FlgM